MIVGPEESDKLSRPSPGARKLSLSLGQKGLVLVGLPLIFELIFIGMLTILLRQAELAADQFARSKNKVTTASAISHLFITTGAALAAYSLQRNQTLEEQFDTALEQIPQELKRLRELSQDNPRQIASLNRIDGAVAEGLELIKSVKAAMDGEGRPDKGALLTGARSLKRFRVVAARLEEDLNAYLEEELKAEKATPFMAERARRMVHSVLWIGTALNVILALLMAHLFYTGITGRLRILTDNSIRLARAEPLNPPISGSDEVSQLDRVFHEMAEALREAARKERAVIENALDVICSIDDRLKFTAVSPASVQVWGYSPEELIGRRFIELILPEDISPTLDAMEQMRERSLQPFENRMIRKDGARVHVLWSAYWSEAERSMFCVAHDITERKQAEEMLRESEERTRNIIESMLVGLMLVDEEGQIELVNPQMEELFEFEADELIGKHVSLLFPKAVEIHLAEVKEGRSQRLTGRLREFDAQRKSGEVFSAELSATRLETAAGPRLLVNVLDVTERGEMERLKREFVTTVSHELRTPLTSIRGALTLLATGSLGALEEQAFRAVKISERNCIRLINLINDLLDIEKLEAGKMNMVFERVSLAPAVERAVEAVKSFADLYGIRLESKIEDCQLCADEDRLIQVLVNLLSNACKYSPPDAAVVTRAFVDKDDVVLQVTDSGRGIPPEARDRIFERFQQVETADSKRRGGTGLGLAISRAIVEQHNGTIGVDSTMGRGSTFWIRLPRWGSPRAPKAAEPLKAIELPRPCDPVSDSLYPDGKTPREADQTA